MAGLGGETSVFAQGKVDIDSLTTGVVPVQGIALGRRRRLDKTTSNVQSYDFY
jgi:hypothetical protein